MTIKQIQALLAYLGYRPGAVDGVNGPQTVAAVQAFQEAEGLEADGLPGAKTQEALKEAVANDRFAPQVGTPASGQPADAVGAPDSPDFWADVRYFRREEFRCRCGGKYCDGAPGEMSEKLIRVAEDVRKHFNAPITVTSGMRCTRHNAAVGGVSNSRHNPQVWYGEGKAMDFRVQGVPGAKVLAYCQSLVAAGRLRYAYQIKNSECVHMDVQ